MSYELVRERKIVQRYQFGKLNLLGGDMLPGPEKEGRPTYREINTEVDEHDWDILWLYTQIDDEPELVDCIRLDC